MGWTPQPRWDATNKRWRVFMKGRMISLGGQRTSYVDVLARFAKKYSDIYGGDPPKTDDPVTVDGLIIAWLTAHGFWSEMPLPQWPSGPRWRRDCLNVWGVFCGEKKVVSLEDLEASNLVDFEAWCRKERQRTNADGVVSKYRWSPKTIKHYVTAALRCWKWGRKHGFIKIDPDEVRLQRSGYEPKDISATNLGDILQKIENSKRLRRAGNVFKFCLMTGCRPGEARTLRWRHIRFDQCIAVYPRDEHKTGRATGESRTIHLSDEAVKLLTEVRLKSARPNEFVFTSRTGEPYSASGLLSIMRRLGTFPYAARHTWGQNAVDRGVSIDVVGEQMGHRDPRTTRQYARVRSARVLDELNALVSPVQTGLRVQSEPGAERKPAKKKSRSQGTKQPKQGTPSKGRGRRTA